MKFPAIIQYTADKAKIAEIRPLHRQYLTTLQERGQLAVAGPFTDDSGALIVYEVETRDEAEALLKADPFNKNGIFVSYQIRPWKPVFFAPNLFTTSSSKVVTPSPSVPGSSRHRPGLST